MNTLDTIRTIITSQQSVDKRKDQYVAVDTDFAKAVRLAEAPF